MAGPCGRDLAGGLGFEPRLAESESAVLPLDDRAREQKRALISVEKRPGYSFVKIRRSTRDFNAPASAWFAAEGLPRRFRRGFTILSTPQKL